MSDIPEALVEKGAAAERECMKSWGDDLGQSEARMRARAVLAAVWPDVPAARPVVDEARLADVLFEAFEAADDDPTRPWFYAQQAAAEVVASGLLQDAADVRRAVAEPLLALADEMENPNAEHGTMPGVRMQVRQYWAGRIRAAIGEQEQQPSEGLRLTSARDLLTDAERADLDADLARMAAQRRRAEAEARDVWLP